MRWFESIRPSIPPRGVSVPVLERVLAAFERGALDEAGACFAEDALYREVGAEPLRGRPAIAAHFARFSASGAAWRFEVDDVLRDGARACVIYRYANAEGASGPWRERAGCATVRIGADDLIAEWREYDG